MKSFVPQDWAKRPSDAKTEQELRRWLRTIPLVERLDFIKSLWPSNEQFALSLVRSSRLPTREIENLLRQWLILGHHNSARGLIEGLVPVLGEQRFWRIASEAELAPQMEDFLNYYGHGVLKEYKSVQCSKGKNA